MAIPTPGHTPHHLSVAVEDEGATILLAGDASYTEANMLAGEIDGVSENEADALSTPRPPARAGRARPVVYLPTHDPSTPERLARTTDGCRRRLPEFAP